MFYLAEYMHMITVSAVGVTIFLGGWRGPVFSFVPWVWPLVWFLIKLFVVVYALVWIRATVPRFRYDRLMSFGWKVLIPSGLLWKVARGFSVTFRQIFRRNVTTQYPKEIRALPPRAHVGRHLLNRHENGLEKCIGCELCAWACPADAIYVQGADNTPENRVSA